MNTLEHIAGKTLGLNEIGLCNIATATPVAFDPYEENRETGAFILVDRFTNATAGAGMIVRALEEESASTHGLAAAERIARAARSASSEQAAVDAVARLLEEILT